MSKLSSREMMFTKIGEWQDSGLSQKAAGLGGLCVGIFRTRHSLQGLVCVGICVPCNVLKIALGSMAKSWVF